MCGAMAALGAGVMGVTLFFPALAGLGSLMSSLRGRGGSREGVEER